MKLKYLCGGIAVLLFAVTPTHAQKQSGKQFESLLERNDREVVQRFQEAAAAARVEIDSRSITHLKAGAATTVLSSLPRLESVSATTLSKGVDIAFGFFDLPQQQDATEPSLPPGFYTIRITTSDKVAEPPSANAQAEFLDSSHKVVARLPAAFGTRQLKASTTDKPSPVVMSNGNGRIIAYCMPVGGRWVCWGSAWMEALDAVSQ